MPQLLDAPPETEVPASRSPSKEEAASEALIDHLLEVPMHAEVILGTIQMRVAAISALQVGTILRTQRPAGEPLDLVVNSALVAAGEVCPQGQKFGLRVVGLHTES